MNIKKIYKALMINENNLKLITVFYLISIIRKLNAGEAMVHIQKLFMRTKNVLKKRYDIELNDNLWDLISIWLRTQLNSSIKNKAINQDSIKPLLELMRRQQPTKFYLLEQNLIKHIRMVIKKEQRPIIRNVVEEIDLSNLSKDKDDDFESSDAFGYIYS